MKKFFRIHKRHGRHSLDIVLESKVTGEVFHLRFGNRKKWRRTVAELKQLRQHIREIRMLYQNGFVKLNGGNVVLLDGYI